MDWARDDHFQFSVGLQSDLKLLGLRVMYRKESIEKNDLQNGHRAKDA